MSAHCFHEIFIHLNWHCDGDMKLIHSDWEPQLHAFFQAYCSDNAGVFYLGSNGTADHVHVVLQIEPSVTISGFVGKIKGASSFEFNKRFGRKALLWQRGYGVVSFAKRDLPGVLKYAENQKQHHADGTLKEKLEIGNSHFELEPSLAEAIYKHAKARLEWCGAAIIHHLKVVANKSTGSRKPSEKCFLNRRVQRTIPPAKTSINLLKRSFSVFAIGSYKGMLHGR